MIWGVKPLFVVQKRGDVTPTEIMLGLAGGMKVNCYLKIIYQQLQEWSTHRYDLIPTDLDLLCYIQVSQSP